MAIAYVVNLNTAILQWDAGVGGGTPTEYRVKAGASSGVYTQTTVVAYPTTQLALNAAVPGGGRWFAAVTAWNADGESGLSNEIVLIATSAEGLGLSDSLLTRLGKKVRERLGIRRKLTPP